MLTKFFEIDIELAEVGEDLEYAKESLGPEIDKMLDGIEAEELAKKAKEETKGISRLVREIDELYEETKKLKAEGRLDEELLKKIRGRTDDLERLLLDAERKLKTREDQVEKALEILDEAAKKSEEFGKLLRQL